MLALGVWMGSCMCVHRVLVCECDRACVCVSFSALNVQSLLVVVVVTIITIIVVVIVNAIIVDVVVVIVCLSSVGFLKFVVCWKMYC